MDKPLVTKVRDFFRDRYGYVNIQAIDDATIDSFMREKHLSSYSFEKQMDLLYDYILSQGLCEVEE